MIRVNVHEAKSQLSRLLARVEAGERVVIARAGEPVAVLSAYRAAAPKRRLGGFAGQGRILEDFDLLPEELLRAFEGEKP